MLRQTCSVCLTYLCLCCSDPTYAGTASSLRDYAAFCVEHQSSEALLANIVQLNAEGCAVDTTSLAMARLHPAALRS